MKTIPTNFLAAASIRSRRRPSPASREHVLFDNVAVPVELGFAGIENVSLAAGNQQDTFNVEGLGSAASLVLDGNGGADLFNVASPAFASINIQGDDAPIFSLRRSALGERRRAVRRGVDSRTLSGRLRRRDDRCDDHPATAASKTADVHPQIYGGPGDFDSNGVVDGEDLTPSDARLEHPLRRRLGRTRLPHLATASRQRRC